MVNTLRINKVRFLALLIFILALAQISFLRGCVIPKVQAPSYFETMLNLHCIPNTDHWLIHAGNVNVTVVVCQTKFIGVDPKGNPYKEYLVMYLENGNLVHYEWRVVSEVDQILQELYTENFVNMK